MFLTNHCESNYVLYRKRSRTELDVEDSEAILQIVLTDLQEKQELNLRQFVLQKVWKLKFVHSNKYKQNSSQAGEICVLNSLNADQGNWICYLSPLLVSLEEKVKLSLFIYSQQDEFILCIICEMDGEEGFKLYLIL